MAMLVASGSVPAQAGGGVPAVVIAAVSWRYSPDPIEISQGEALTFANADAISALSGDGHSLAHAVKPGQELFQSPITPLGAASNVAGVAALPRGEYGFTCRVHAFMHGTLVVR
ncbi:MAG: cupredoxin domain-containing protein [Acidimicrobiia bacterium]